MKEKDLIYMDNVAISLNKEIVATCLDFAEQKKKYNNRYIANRNADPYKIFHQDSYSKACEFAASSFLENLGLKKMEVDTKIYSSFNKNWDSDLGKSISVKSTSLDMSGFVKRGTNGESSESWTFQYADKFGTGGCDGNIFSIPPEIQSKKYVIFTTIENEEIKENTLVYIRGLVRLKHLHDCEMFKDPIARKLQGIKKNVYDSDLKKLQIIFNQISYVSQ